MHPLQHMTQEQLHGLRIARKLLPLDLSQYWYNPPGECLMEYREGYSVVYYSGHNI